MMYIRYFFLLKFSSLVTMSLIRDSVKQENASTYSNNHISTTHPATIFKPAMEQSSDGSRIEFQIRNHRGPGTYIFGFDTGNGKNRQYRMEERFRDGSVKGRYGFYDAKGKLKIIDYVAGPNGYQERHHETLSFRSGI